jgi:ferric-dicitrate binding protein FerR (iron transport regulator)
MLLKRKIDWSLLAKYMAGETSTRETEAIQKWTEDRPENKALLQEVNSDWKKMDNMNVRYDVDSAWNKLHSRIVTENVPDDTAITPVKSRTLIHHFSAPLRVAASLVLLAILGVALVAITGRMLTIQVTASQAEKGKMITMPDGSSVTLNANTRLKYARNFGKRHRDVTLNGEAFFEVTTDKMKPFRINAGNARIKVLGTSFNVNTQKNNNQVEVFVSTGIVELSEASNEDNKILLHPGNIGIVRDNKALSAKTAENENAIAWKTGELSFDETPLSEVIPVLNDVYDVNIVVTEAGIETIRINGEYHSDPIDQILQIICTQNEENQLKVAKSADTIYLSR